MANKLTSEQKSELLETLQTRFEKHMIRHIGISWGDVLKNLENNEQKLWSLSEMERTGGEPDVIGQDAATGEYLFADCSKQTPTGRRSLCYDRKALDDRKTFKPESSAVDMATEMGIELLTEEQYRKLQTLGDFDLTTSSWIATPEEVRKLGGSLFADKRFGRVFVYHNGASSYYASRGFRGILRI